MLYVVRAVLWHPSAGGAWSSGPSLTGGSATGRSGVDRVVLFAERSWEAETVAGREMDLVVFLQGRRRLDVRRGVFEVWQDAAGPMLVMVGSEAVSRVYGDRERPGYAFALGLERPRRVAAGRGARSGLGGAGVR